MVTAQKILIGEAKEANSLYKDSKSRTVGGKFLSKWVPIGIVVQFRKKGNQNMINKKQREYVRLSNEIDEIFHKKKSQNA